MENHISVVFENGKYFLVKEKASKIPISGFMAFLNKHPSKDKIDFQKALRFATSKLKGKIDITKSTNIIENKEIESKRFDIKISDDKMKASINILEEGIKKEEILLALKKMDIRFGINFDLLDKIEKNAKINDNIIARGLPPVPGKDGYIKMLIKKPSKKPVLSEDGKVNFYELDFITGVKEGEILAIRYPPVPGKDGINIFAQRIPAKTGKPAKFNLGKGIKIEENKAIAKYDGCIVWENGTPHVDEVVLIKGDVDSSTGNINVNCHVFVNGWVRSGFKVMAKKNIQIEGGIENAVVESENGNITVKLGVTGGNNCFIKAKKEIRSKFINNATVVSNDSVIINEYIMNSSVLAKKYVILNGKRGELLNVDIEAKAGIMVNLVKSMKKSNQMKIHGIDRDKIFRELNELQAQTKELEVRMRELSVKIKSIANNKDLRPALIRFIDEFQRIKEDYDKHIENVHSLKFLLANTRGEGILKVFKNSTYLRAMIKDKVVTLDPSNYEIEIYYDPDKKEVIRR